MSAVATTADQVLLAADAAIGLLPIPAGAVVEAATPADLASQWAGVVRRFTGARGGATALLLNPAAADALSAALAQATAPPSAADPAEAAADAATADAAVAGVGTGLGAGADAVSTAEFVAALVPALDAMSATVGPIAVLDAKPTTGAMLQELLAAAPVAAVAVITVDGNAAAYIALCLDAAPAGPGVPAPRLAGDAPLDGPDAMSTARGMDLLRSVPMEVTAEIGRTRMTIQELLSLSPGAVVELDRPVGSPADVLVNGRLFARGEVVVVDEDFAIRITEIVDPNADPTAA